MIDLSYMESIEYFNRVTVSTRQLQDLGWSDARIKAYDILERQLSRFKGRAENPNLYYYRFNDPGEKQETGKWSPKDRYLFLKQLVEHGMDYSVGITAAAES